MKRHLKFEWLVALCLCFSMTTYAFGLSSQPFKVISIYVPKSEWAVAAIVPTQSNLTNGRKVELCRFARKQLQGVKCKRLSLLVFQDDKTVNIFKKNQLHFQDNQVSKIDLQKMKSVWAKTAVYYEYSHGKERFTYPSLNPAKSWQVLQSTTGREERKNLSIPHS